MHNINLREYSVLIAEKASDIVEKTYKYSNLDVWNPNYCQDVCPTSVERDLHIRRVLWIRSEIESEVWRRSGASSSPDLFTTKAALLTLVISSTYNSMLQHNSNLLRSREFLLENIQSGSRRTIGREIYNCLQEGLLLEVKPKNLGRIKTQYLATIKLRKLWAISLVGVAATRIAWSIIDARYDARDRMSNWCDVLGHDRGIIDYICSEMQLQRSRISNDKIEWTGDVEQFTAMSS